MKELMALGYINCADEFRSGGVTEFLGSVCSAKRVSGSSSGSEVAAGCSVQSRGAELCVLLCRHLPAHAQSSPVLLPASLQGVPAALLTGCGVGCVGRVMGEV